MNLPHGVYHGYDDRVELPSREVAYYDGDDSHEEPSHHSVRAANLAKAFGCSLLVEHHRAYDPTDVCPEEM